jgi:hypothetical protein
MSNKFGIKEYLQGASVFAPEIDITDDTKIRLITNRAAPSNTIVLYGRIAGQDTWTIVDTLTGSGQKDFTVSMYDFVRLECTVFSAIGGLVELVGSGFQLTSGVHTITTPDGDLTGLDTLELISSDSSVIISSISPNIIDIRSVGGGGSSLATKYVKTITLTDWATFSGEYVLTIPFSTHAIANPVVNCYENNGSSFDLLIAPVNIDTSNNITIYAVITPDTRFVGKIIIE